tara:strand:- start:72 stop:1778 length:1707 start_codon:yes stop_codon:yes gene_type:complete
LKNKIPKKSINVAILGGSTTDLIKKTLSKLMLANKIKVNIYESNYNQFYFEAINISKKLKSFNPDIIYIHITNINIEPFPKVEDSDAKISKLLKQNIEKFHNIWKSLTKEFNCTIIQNNFEFLNYSSLGNLDSSKNYGKINFINQLNAALCKKIQNFNNIIINDINLISSRFGLKKWQDDTLYFNYKYALSFDAIQVLAYSISRIILSLLGKSKKCLVVDFDNTIWGGVIGEVGEKNIEIGNDSPRGEIFLRFQKYLLDLTSIGIILAGCTKNEYKVAASGLKNKNCIIKENNFAVIQANWKNKAENIRIIAKKLNIGLDSIVFVDDSKFERESVKTQLPMVAVPEIGEDPENFIHNLDILNYFEKSILSKEDLKRSNYYENNFKREQIKTKYKDYKEYLKSLKMKSLFKNFNKFNMTRVVQLINKTNQFNLTMKRMSEKDVLKISNDKDYLTISANLEDKFGDNGIVTIFIAKIKKRRLEIKSWLMSCRVFNRNLEIALFDQLIILCKKKGIENIHGTFIPSDKNNIVKNFYASLNFKKNGKNKWKFKVEKKYKKQEKIIKVINEIK